MPGFNTMQIQLESTSDASIHSYTETSVTANNITYTSNVLMMNAHIIPHWEPADMATINLAHLAPILQLHPKTILIGHTNKNQFPSPTLIKELADSGIGIESMSIGAACRTYNLLLNEGREVALGLIFFKPSPSVY